MTDFADLLASRTLQKTVGVIASQDLLIAHKAAIAQAVEAQFQKDCKAMCMWCHGLDDDSPCSPTHVPEPEKIDGQWLHARYEQGIAISGRATCHANLIRLAWDTAILEADNATH